MASKKGKKKKETNDEESGEALPAGFQRVNAEGGAPFVKPEKGMVIQGVLLGRFPRAQNPNQYIYQIRVTIPVRCVVGREDEKRTITVDPGGTVNIDERTALKDLKEWVEKDFYTEVYIRFEGKETTQKGNSFWKCAVGARKAPPETIEVADLKEEQNQQFDDIPF